MSCPAQLRLSQGSPTQPRRSYGGIYTWDDVAAMRAYQRGKIFHGLQADPHMIDVAVRDFSVLARPTKVTRGGY